MITVFTGENSFEIERALQALTTTFAGASESFDGTTLTRASLPDLLMGVSLFSAERLVFIKNLSDNKALWTEFSDWLPRISSDIHLVLIEPKPDKRTKTYKDLQKAATVQEYKLWGERDVMTAQAWAIKEAKLLGFTLNAEQAQTLVRRVGTDQWLLFGALQKLAVMGEVSTQVIEDIIAVHPSENVFHLFEAALKGESRRVQAMVATLALTEEPYRLFGLLSGQAFQLAALAFADKPLNETAKDLGAHPFTLGKLEPYAKKLHRADVKRVITAFAEADEAMKTSSANPWLLIERALVKVTIVNIKK